MGLAPAGSFTFFLKHPLSHTDSLSLFFYIITSFIPRGAVIMMDWLYIFLGAIFILVGIIGCFLPVLPGPPISFLGILILQLTSNPPFSTEFIFFWGLITLAVTIMDYVIPVYGTKRFGGSKYGVIGSMIGLIIGIIFFPPLGIIIGPLVGAILGEYYSGKSSNRAMKSALGSFMGFLLGTFIKLIVSLVLAFYFFINIF